MLRSGNLISQAAWRARIDAPPCAALKAAATVACAAALALVAYLDYCTGREIRLTAMYLLPIGFAAWFAGSVAGVVFSTFSALCHLYLKELMGGYAGSHAMAPYWNTGMYFCLFLVVVFLIGRLRAMFERKDALLRMKNEFLGMAVHDLRNPLGNIRGFAQLLQSGNGTSGMDSQEALTRIINSTERMLNLVNGLLDVSAIESGSLQLRLVRGSLWQMVMERSAWYVANARRKQIEVRFTHEEAPDVDFDAEHLGQVLDNLVDNALKFSLPKTAVEISLFREGARAILGIRDQGPGIPEIDYERIFVPFQKSIASPTAGERSTGLGLAIARRIVEAHAGTITIAGRLGVGSLFRIALPIAKGCPASAAVVNGHGAARRS